MNGTTRVFLPATITEIGDGPYCYAACQECYSKLIELKDGLFMCMKCGRSLARERVVYRYRLSMTITDFSTYATIAAFGGTLNAYFGCAASEFHRRWMKQLQILVGDLEPTVSKWAIEEALLGCRMFFGFKVQTDLLHGKKAHKDCRICLKDISEQSDKSVFPSKAENGLVALQVVSQNSSHLPRPVTIHLQNVTSFWANENVVNGVVESHQVKFLQFMRKQCEKNRQRISNNLTSVLLEPPSSDDSSSLLSSIDQTSIGLSCNYSLESPVLTGRHNRSHVSRTANASQRKSATKTAAKPVSASESNISSTHLLSSPNSSFLQRKSDVQRTRRRRFELETSFSKPCTSKFKMQAKRDAFGDQIQDHCDNSGSFALFENSVFSSLEGPEKPRIDSSAICSSVSGLLSQDVFSIVDEEEVENASSDLSNYQEDTCKDQSDIFFPQSHSYLHKASSCDRHETNKYCETFAHNLECGNSTTKFVNRRKLCLKGLTKDLASSETVINSDDKSLKVLLNKSVEMHSQFLSSHLSLSTNNAMKDSFIDMPESEDLELFLAAANFSADQGRMTRDVWPNDRDENFQSNKENMFVNIEQGFSSMKQSQHHIIQIQDKGPASPESDNSALFKPECQTNRVRQEQMDCQKLNFETPHAHSSTINNSENEFKSALGFNKFHRDTNQLKRQINVTQLLRTGKQHVPSEVEFLEPLILNNDFQGINIAAKSAFKSRETNSGTNNSDNSKNEWRQTNDSSDLFSSEDSSLDSEALYALRRLSLGNQTQPLCQSNQKNSSVSLKSGMLHVCEMSNDYNVVLEKGYCDNISSGSQNQSYDLFSTPASSRQTKSGQDRGICVRTSSPRPELIDNSFDLFSSGDEL